MKKLNLIEKKSDSGDAKYVKTNSIISLQKTYCIFSRPELMKCSPGERYCLKLDTQEMVAGVDDELRKLTTSNNIQGVFNYGSVYSTYTIYLKPGLEVVVASKINGMTDDFLATIRNAEMTENHFPVLMITASAIDTITSGTGDLSATGMPFNSAAIIDKIKSDINNAQLPLSDRVLLEMEVVRKQTDRFSDKSSLYEYAELLTVLGRGYVKEEDYSSFSLLYDPAVQPLQDPKKIKDRLVAITSSLKKLIVFLNTEISKMISRQSLIRGSFLI